MWQAGPLNRHVLQAVDFFGIGDPQYRTGSDLPNRLFERLANVSLYSESQSREVAITVQPFLQASSVEAENRPFLQPDPWGRWRKAAFPFSAGAETSAQGSMLANTTSVPMPVRKCIHPQPQIRRPLICFLL